MVDENNRTLWNGLWRQICIQDKILLFASLLGYLHRYLLPVAQDGLGISWILVEISFCRPKKNSKIFKLNAKKDAFYVVRRLRQFSWKPPWFNWKKSLLYIKLVWHHGWNRYRIGPKSGPSVTMDICFTTYFFF